MKPEQKSKTFLAITRSKGKMYEYGVPLDDHISLKIDPAMLLVLSIALLGDLSASYGRKTVEVDNLVDDAQTLQFSAYFFDAYFQSRLAQESDSYLTLLGSASYYLCELPGSAAVLAGKLKVDELQLECQGLENLLLWLLQNNFFEELEQCDSPYGQFIKDISNSITRFFKSGDGADNLFQLCSELRKEVYQNGTARELLISDAIVAVITKKHRNSTWYSLPLYTDLDKDQWAGVLKKDSFIKELWPAQHLFGKKNVFRGSSAVVQMPTSAGKTKAIEIVIRSAFISDRTSLSVIVAPFRALCHEIRNNFLTVFQNENVSVDELTDVMQEDFKIEEFLVGKQIIVITPEKLLYILRHTSGLASKIGLIIFDEGHQFDSGTRGITYELLLTSLRMVLPSSTQKILISAVISNAPAVSEWLNGPDSEIIQGTNLLPTHRSIGFTTWTDQMGQIRFVSNENTDQEDFFVPRVLEKIELQKKSRERKNRTFPEKSESQEIALYLGLKLVRNGSVAIFCGTKSAVAKICEKAVEVFDRGLKMNIPTIFSDKEEISKLCYLNGKNLGTNSIFAKSAELGIFAHDRNIPQGIRLAVEHAMREDLIKFVVCTSTLAQGVNLPIRYLIVTSVKQGLGAMKVRDFHNLMGRAGRSGMHTEGSILFADPTIYDKKFAMRERWRWREVKNLLDPSKSEECVSSLSKLIPLKIYVNGFGPEEGYLEWDILSFAAAYVEGDKALLEIIDDMAKSGDISREAISFQFVSYAQLLASIENFLISNWDLDNHEITEEQVIELAKNTLAFSLANKESQDSINKLFLILAKNIKQKSKDATSRAIYSRTLYGLKDAQFIENWVQANLDNLLESNEEKLINTIWPLLIKFVRNNVFNKLDSPEILKQVAYKWVKGVAYHELLEAFTSQNAQVTRGKQKRQVTIENTVDLFENGLSYEGSFLLGAIIEFADQTEIDNKEALIRNLKLIQKKIKYGLPTVESVLLHEAGFSDRIIAQEVAAAVGQFKSSLQIKSLLLENNSQVEEIIQRYPAYYLEIYTQLIAG